MWLFREVSAPYLFFLAQLNPVIQWRSKFFKLRSRDLIKLSGVEILSTVKLSFIQNDFATQSLPFTDVWFSDFFVSEWANLHDEISNKKYVSKYNIVSQIGAMLRSVFLQVIRQRGNVIKILRP